MSSKKESVRDAFGKKLAELCQREPRILVLDGDLGNSTRTSIVEEKAPDAFLQMGIAEQNMIGVAAGLASTGFQPWVCSFAAFLTRRAYDQIAISVDQPGFDVKLVGAYSGLLTSNTGKTHHSLEDIALMTILPNMTVIAPADANETVKAMEAMHRHAGPVYLRLTREEIEQVTDDRPFVIGEGRVLREGSDMALISTGSMTHQAVHAADLLQEKGLSVYHLHLPTLKPMDRTAVLAAAKAASFVVTLEEHFLRGGMGSMAAEILAETHPTNMLRIGVDNQYSECGKNQDLLSKHGLTSQLISERILQFRDRMKGVSP